MTIKINDDLVLATQRAHMECDGLAYLLTYMMKNNMDKNSEHYKDYENKYIKAFNNFEASKSLVEAEIRKEVLNPVSWSLDYNTRTAEVETL